MQLEKLTLEGLDLPRPPLSFNETSISLPTSSDLLRADPKIQDVAIKVYILFVF